MNGRGRLRIVSVAVALVAASSGVARADDARVKAAREALSRVSEWIARSCPGGARAALKDAEAKIAALDEREREKLARELESRREGVDRLARGWGAERVLKVTGETLEAIESIVGSIDDSPRGGALFDDMVQLLELQMADPVNKALLPPDEVARISKKIDSLREEYRKGSIKQALKAYDDLAQLANGGVTQDGWESESTPNSLEAVANDASKDLGCEKTRLYARNAGLWLENPFVKTTRERNPDDPDLKKLAETLVAGRAKALAKYARFETAVLEQAEKLPAGATRDKMFDYYGDLVRPYRTPEHEPFDGGEVLLKRVIALVERWEADRAQVDAGVAQARREREAFLKSLPARANAAWPVMVEALHAERLEPTEALTEIAAWKGRTVRFAGKNVSGTLYEQAFWLTIEVDGVPVSGDLDPELDKSIAEFLAKIGMRRWWLGDVEEVTCVVEGGCKAWPRVKRGDRYVRGTTQVDGVRVRIVGLKTRQFAGACGQGTNLDVGGEASASTSVPPSTGTGTGTAVPADAPGDVAPESNWLHGAHRIVAWAMALVLGFAGLLALVHGVARFVPSLQEQKAKIGSAPGYAGVALAVLGVGWFGAAIVVPFVVSECRFGSLPAVALGLAGLVLGLDVLRARGSIKPETAVAVQPAGIVLGLACFAAAALHVLLWDKPLL